MVHARVGVVVGAESDLEVLRPAVDALGELEVGCEVRVLSTERALEYAGQADERGLRVLIAGGGGAAHLAAVCAAVTSLPVIGVPIATSALSGLEALAAVARRSSGAPVATVVVDGGRDAGLLAARVLGVGDDALRARYDTLRAAHARKWAEVDDRVSEQFAGRSRGSGVGFR